MELKKYIKELELGSTKNKKIKLKNNIIVAPMAGITDRAFRQINYEISDIALIYDEMVSAKAVVYKDQKTLNMLKAFEGEDERIRGIQLFGDDPKDFKNAILEIKQREKEGLLNIDIIDINMGCPAPKVVKNGAGCFILKNLKLASEIAKEARSVWNKVLGFKIRIGISEESINAKEVCKILEKEGADYIIIHARTYEGMFSAEPNYDIVREIKNEANIPIIYNGGIFSKEDAASAFEKTNADGICIARGAFLNPYLVSELAPKDKDKNKKENKENKEKKEKKEKLIKQIRRHFELNVKYLGEKRGATEFRKNLIWYSKAFEGSNVLRSKISLLKDKESFKIFDEELKKLNLKK